MSYYVLMQKCSWRLSLLLNSSRVFFNSKRICYVRIELYVILVGSITTVAAPGKRVSIFPTALDNCVDAHPNAVPVALAPAAKRG